MRFDAWSYLYPPRPDKAISPSFASFYEDRGYVAQVKMNGTCNMISVSPEKKLVTMNRHNEPHRLWMPSVKSSAAFEALPGPGWYVFVAELMHSKVTGFQRDTNYIHDVLVADGEYLVGQTWAERQEVLAGLFETTDTGSLSHLVINENTWLARNHFTGFDKLYADVQPHTEMEGLVFKNQKAKLALCSRENANNSWQVKCRKGGKNYTS
jgi:hypothetical protein